MANLAGTNNYSEATIFEEVGFVRSCRSREMHGTEEKVQNHIH